MASFLTGIATGFLQRAQEQRDTAEVDRRTLLRDAMARYNEAIARNEQRLEQEIERRRLAQAGAALSGMPLQDAEGFAAAGARLSDFGNIRQQTGQAFGQPPAPPMDYATGVTAIENNTGNPAARNPASTATGNGQFIESTWLSLWNQGGREAASRAGLNVDGLDPNRPEDREAILALRTNPALSREMINVYRDQNRAPLQRALGRAPTDSELYVAHFLGPQGAQQFLTADPSTPADRVVSGAALANNRSVFIDPATGRARTVGDVMQSFNQRFAASAPPGGEVTTISAARSGIEAPRPTPTSSLLPPDPPENRSISERMRDAFFGGDPTRGLSEEVRRRYGESRGLSPEQLARLEAGPSRDVPGISGRYSLVSRGTPNTPARHFRTNEDYQRYVASGGTDVSGLRDPAEIQEMEERLRSAATRARGTGLSQSQIAAQSTRFGRMAADAMGIDNAYENGRLVLRSGTDEARTNATVLGQRAFRVWGEDFNYDATRMHDALVTAADQLRLRPPALDRVQGRFNNGDYEFIPQAPQPGGNGGQSGSNAPSNSGTQTPQQRAREEQRQRQLARDTQTAIETGATMRRQGRTPQQIDAYFATLPPEVQAEIRRQSER